MTDKTPEGRKSDTMPLKGSNMRERAEKIERDYYSANPTRFDLVNEIEQAFLQAEKEGFERAREEVADVVCELQDAPELESLRAVIKWLDKNNPHISLEKSRIEREIK